MQWCTPTLATPFSSKKSTNRGVASGNRAALTLRGPERVENTRRREKRKKCLNLSGKRGKKRCGKKFKDIGGGKTEAKRGAESEVKEEKRGMEKERKEKQGSINRTIAPIYSIVGRNTNYQRTDRRTKPRKENEKKRSGG